MATWIMVAHRAGARLYRHAPAAPAIELLREYDNPDGRKRDGDFDADRPGRADEGHGGLGRHAMRKKQTPTDHAAETFAKQLASELQQGRTARDFEEVMLVAAPAFLGRLRAAMDDATVAKISSSVAKDFASVGDHELRKRLAELLAAK